MALWPFGRHKKRARRGDDEVTTTTTTTTTTAPAASSSPARQPHTPPAQTEAATKTATTGGHGFSAGRLVRRDSKRQKYSGVSPAAAPPVPATPTAITTTAPAATSSPVAITTPATPATAATAATDSPMTLPAGRALRQPTSVDTFASVNALAPSKLRQSEHQHHQNTMMSQVQIQDSRDASTAPYLVPTLHGKRYPSEPTSILRRRSERRRRIDPEREQEIKRMGSLVWEHPKRNNNNNNNPSTATATSNRDKHLSDPFTSSPAPSAPIRDQGESPSYTFKLGALNALSPRPFLRYASADGTRSSLPPTADISRSSTTRDKAKPRWFSADQAAATAGSSKKIEELADSMDAGALRQLMDRDRRRRLVKRQILREQQQQQAAAAARQAEEASAEHQQQQLQTQQPEPESRVEPQVEQQQLQTQTQPLEKIVTAGTTSIPSSQDRMDVSKPQSQQQSLQQTQSWLQDASKESLVKGEHAVEIETATDVLKTEHGRQSQVAPSTVLSRNGQTLELALPADEHRDEIPDIREHPAFRQPSVSETSASASLSVSASASASTKPSTMLNETKLGRTWTQLFRRRGTLRRKPNRNILPKNGSSEFSVTSRTHQYFNRGGAAAAHHGAGSAASHPIAIGTAASSHRAGTDTQSITSKFTEHLDDGCSGSGSAVRLSTSAPGPRMYSPEPPYNLHREDSYSVSVSASQRMSGAEKYSISGMSAGAGIGAGTYVSGPDTRPNSTFLAQSLASIDSEGSWLSGRPSRRLSQAPLKSPGSTRERLDDTSPIIDPDLEDDNAISSDEYFGALPVPKEEEEEEGTFPKHHRGLNITTASNDAADVHHPAIMNGHSDEAEISPLPEEADDGMALANADGDPPTWHSSVGKQPRLVNPETRAKSREGLFTEFIDSENEISPIDEPEDVTEIRRAQSVDLGRHIRHMSVGSAKLVTLSRAESSGKRHSSISMSSSGIFPSRADDEI
ncbi:hypothetical protein MGYG_03252 [Nannizzia gypsea CBS 118893]|uniref:Uncharacterized protein n=1 Tax=Arthroderma gypseum (strain ATCC MYA-4604 / CBS 118893) TaxID=535722 RepID=E4URN9_ARTGP|nr:hypothetical protein MGYG_03252 [Nannizzia gypsea CBS 118893]EFR00249.1 hypothetical protein MGYG_03252 [Nannizzia gypsea CBS 118893]